MNTRFHIHLTVFVLLNLLLSACPQPARAEGAWFWISPSSGPAGAGVSISDGGEFTLQGPADIVWDAGPVIGAAMISENGVPSGSFYIPGDALAGSHEVSLCAPSRTDCQEKAIAPFTVDPTKPPEPPYQTPTRTPTKMPGHGNTPTFTPTPTRTPTLGLRQVSIEHRCTDLGLGAGAETINFDSLSAGTMTSGQFRSQGLTFTYGASVADNPPMGAHSGSRAVRNITSDMGGAIPINFTLPVSAVGLFVGRAAPSGSGSVFAVLTAYGASSTGSITALVSDRVLLPNAATAFEYCLVVRAPAGATITSASLNYVNSTGTPVTETRWMDDLTFTLFSGRRTDLPPQITIVTPVAGSVVRSSTVPLIARIREDNLLNSVGVYFGTQYAYLDCEHSSAADPTLYDCYADLSGLTLGSNTFRVVAQDRTGNSTEARVTIDYQPPVEGDLWITGMEVTQSIQTDTNTIPLIGNKVTVVRVYVRSREDARGPWNDVSATLTVSGGGPSYNYTPANISARLLRTPGGTAMPTITVPPSGSQRNDLESGFYFILDRRDTAPGDRTLTVRIFSVSGRGETDATNNSSSLAVHFSSPLSISIYGQPITISSYQTYQADSQGYGQFVWQIAQPAPFSNFEGHRVVAEAMLPVSSFTILPVPGIGPLPATSTAPTPPPPAFTGLDEARAWAGRMAPRISSTAKLYLLEQYGSCICGLTDGSRRWMNGQDNRRADQLGVVLAHECAHAYGLWWHVVSPPDHTADMPNSNYPHTHGSIGSQIGINTSNPADPRVVAPTGSGHIHDLMVYGDAPYWISPYTYCQLMASLGGPSCSTSTQNALQAPPGDRAALLGIAPVLIDFHLPDFRLAEERPYLQISGWIYADDTVSFAPFETIYSKEDLTTTSQTGNFQISVEDSTGLVLGTYGIELDTTDGEPLEHFFFTVITPQDPAIARVSLLLEGEALITYTASPNSPVVQLVAPNGGEEWSGVQTISWMASDSDWENLTFALEYSPNAGMTWLPLGSGIKGSAFEADFDALPGSDQAMLRIMASDGFNSSSDLSDATFSVPRKAPQVSLSSPEAGSELYEGLPFVMRGSAYDWEDGQLQETAYKWSSDRDGELGSGPWLLVPGLSAGEHLLMVTVQDSDGNQASASVLVTILARPVEEIPLVEPGPYNWSPGLTIALLVIGAVAVAAVTAILLRRKRRSVKTGSK